MKPKMDRKANQWSFSTPVGTKFTLSLGDVMFFLAERGGRINFFKYVKWDTFTGTFSRFKNSTRPDELSEYMYT